MGVGISSIPPVICPKRSARFLWATSRNTVRGC
ncbi:hypothetical protein E2C01_082523 [Portunus trituberculatus]|uniref:Uncharacterized protein n=1 Tax=Portunus trituberculatus TaxID=210409 RepID=A0A5B7IQ60_PORTR|nr:hypothetical protein [Portunus trituberculatus]